MYRYSDRSGLVGDGSCNGLSDPPCGVRTELVALGVVELVDSFDQAQISFLDKIEEQHSSSDIFLGDRNYETQVGLAQLLFGPLVALFHPLGQFDFLFSRKQRHLAYLLEIHSYRVIDSDCLGYRRLEVDFLGLRIFFELSPDFRVVFFDVDLRKLLRVRLFSLLYDCDTDPAQILVYVVDLFR